MQEGGPQIQKAGGGVQQLLELPPLVGEQAVGAVFDLAAGLGTDVAVEGVQHGAGVLLHLDGGNLDEFMEGKPLPCAAAVEGGVPLQIQKNQLGHLSSLQ